MATTHATARSAARTTAGTYFLSLTVENVRCFGPAQTLDLSDGRGGHAPWTVILGENGLGKTTLLTCLAAIPRTGYPGEQEPDHQIRLLWEGIDLEPLFRGSGDVQARFEAGVVFYDRARRNGQVEVKIRNSSDLHGSPPLVGQEADVSRHELVRYLLCFRYGAGRRMPQGKSLAQYDERAGIFLDDDVALRNPEDWLLKADYNARLGTSDAERFATFVERVRGALVNVLPEVADLRIAAADAPGGSPRVEAKTPDGWVPLRRLGFGYQSQIAWLVDFASRMFERYPDSPDPLAEPAVVLVDEIDLHMHPRWQRQIIGYLSERCPNAQFIVTAHSPLVVQAAAGANIVLLRREGDHVVVDNDPEVLENWRVDQILTSELFGLESARPPQIEEQLKKRREILAKPKLTGRDRARLAVLEAQIGELPAGESAEDRRAMELIRRAAEKLQSDA
jgi:energy-coupling factor transporter ATP-binding protein EcfA2